MKNLLVLFFVTSYFLVANSNNNPNKLFVSMMLGSENNKTIKLGQYLMSMAYKKHNARASYLMGVFFDEMADTKKDKNYTVSINLYLDAYKYYKDENNTKEMIKSVKNLGIDFFKIYDYNSSKKYLKIASNLGDDDSTYILSKIYLWEYAFAHKNKNERLLIHNKIKNLYEKLLESKKYHGISLVKLGAWYSDNRDYKLAIKSLLEAVNSYKINDANLILSSVYEKLNDTKKANYYKAEYFSNLNLTIEKLDNIEVKLPSN